MRFLGLKVVLAMHDLQLSVHGGLAGIRDLGLLESALARPQHRHSFGEEDLHVLAASLAFGIARNHPFLDGNKRSALHAALTFLKLNGADVPLPSPEMVEVMVRLAQGALDEAGFADWLRAQSVKS